MRDETNPLTEAERTASGRLRSLELSEDGQGTIRADNFLLEWGTGPGDCRILIDGVELRGVTRVEFLAEVGERPSLNLRMIPVGKESA